MIATKMTNATATQNSALMVIAAASALEHAIDGGFHRLAGGRGPDQPFDDRRGGVDRDAAHIGERGLLGGRDDPLGVLELGVELALQDFAGPLGLGVELLAGLV